MAARGIAETRVRVKGTRLYLATASEPAFDGAGSGRRLQAWRPPGTGINSLISSNLSDLRNRSRDVERKNPWVRSAVSSYTANAVGTGIKPMSLVENEGKRQQIQQLWEGWTDESDADGVSDFYGQQGLVVNSLFTAGEVLARFRPRRASDGLLVPLQIQLIEADHLDHGYNTLAPNGNKIIAGIEFDALGRRAAYWLWRDHPGEWTIGMTSGERVRIPASEIIHVYQPLRPGQVRGVPWLSTVLLRLRDLLEYEDAELVRKKFAAMFTAFITKVEDPSSISTDGLDDDGEYVGALEPGTTQLLKPGEDVKFSQPADVGANYDIFMKWVLRSIAAGIGVTYEQLTNDLSDVNFSSIRAGLNEFQRKCEALQEQVVVFQFCRPIWRRWMTEAVFAGALSLPGFAANPGRWLRCHWKAPGWRYVNPEVEVAAEQAEIRNGTNSRRRIVSGKGLDVEVIDSENAADNARADTLGLVYDSDARKTARNGATKTAGGDTDQPQQQETRA